MTTLADLAELVRAPAALTVPGDTLAGGAAAGWPGGARSAVLPLASVSLYWAGMALNDWADRDLDATERPERPIPSGRVRPHTALGVATGLTATGVGLAAAGGGARAGAVATVLAAAVWAYDLSPKAGPTSTAVMASTRGLDVLLGAAAGGRPGLRAAAGPALLLTAHTAGVTALSRGEVRGTSPTVARGALATTGVVAATAPLLALARTSSVPRPVRVAGAVLAAGAYARAVGRAQARAVRAPSAPAARAATVSGIRGMVPLQAALLGAAGAPGAAAALAGIVWSARSLTRRGTPT